MHEDWKQRHGIAQKTEKKIILWSTSVSELAGAASGAVLFLLTIIISNFYFQQMLFSCSKSHYLKFKEKQQPGFQNP